MQERQFLRRAVKISSCFTHSVQINPPHGSEGPGNGPPVTIDASWLSNLQVIGHRENPGHRAGANRSNIMRHRVIHHAV